MCGIVGSVNFELDSGKIKSSMLHRGPDRQSLYESENVSLFHLRLAIIDLEGGNQPMHFKDRYSIVFNGEIYNYKDLNDQYNLSVKSTSDTETILHLYDLLGPKFLHEVDGMFALAIFDKKKKEVFLARDRAGKKPLFYFQEEDQIVFASELNCLKSLLNLDINHNYITDYLRQGSYFQNRTPYKNVKELSSGSYCIVNTRNAVLKETKWWNIQDYYKQSSNLSLTESLNLVDKKLHTAVERRIIASDLEVGSFLSGGIDSGIVCGIASEYSNRIKTFTVSFPGSFDESALAKLVAQKYNTDHTEIKISFDKLEQDIEGILLNYGEPFYDSSAIPSYYVAQAAKEYVTVVLNGDGADELFGGYRRYVPFAKKDWFNSSPLVSKTASIFSSALPFPRNKKSYYNYLYRLLDFISTDKQDLYYAVTTDIFEGYLDKLKKRPQTSLLQSRMDSFNGSSFTGLEKIMMLDFDVLLFSDLLVKMDIATMAHSLEGRSPFLGKELLEFAPTLQDHHKINGTKTKYILRELGKKYLPEALINQPKRGFEIPLKGWINGQLNNIIMDYLESPSAIWSNYIESKWFKGVLDKSIKVSPEKRAKMIWTVFSLEVWNRSTYAQ